MPGCRQVLRIVKELMKGNDSERLSKVGAVDETFKQPPESKKRSGRHKECGL